MTQEAQKAQKAELEICIIGAGMSGLVMGIQLQKDGKRFRIFEKATSVGGTWRENTYPGLGLRPDRCCLMLLRSSTGSIGW